MFYFFKCFFQQFLFHKCDSNAGRRDERGQKRPGSGGWVWSIQPAHREPTEAAPFRESSSLPRRDPSDADKREGRPYQGSHSPSICFHPRRSRSMHQRGSYHQLALIIYYTKSILVNYIFYFTPNIYLILFLHPKNMTLGFLQIWHVLIAQSWQTLLVLNIQEMDTEPRILYILEYLLSFKFVFFSVITLSQDVRSLQII